MPQFGLHRMEQRIEQKIMESQGSSSQLWNYGTEIMSKTNLKVLPLFMMENQLKFRSCRPGTLAGIFRRSSV